MNHCRWISSYILQLIRLRFVFHLHKAYFVPAVSHLFRRLPFTPIGQVLRGKSVQLQKAAGLVEVQQAVNTSSDTPQIPVVDSHGEQAKIFRQRAFCSCLFTMDHILSQFMRQIHTHIHVYIYIYIQSIRKSQIYDGQIQLWHHIEALKIGIK